MADPKEILGDEEPKESTGTVYERMMFAGGVPVSQDGDEYRECMLAQPNPGTKIGLNEKGEACKGLVYRGCNMLNCIPPDDAKVDETCLTAQLSRCTHLEPELLKMGVTPCPENCEHIVSQTPQWQPATKEEFTAEKVADSKTAKVRVTTTTDAVGLVTQVIEKLAPVREHKFLGAWREGKGVVME